MKIVKILKSKSRRVFSLHTHTHSHRHTHILQLISGGKKQQIGKSNCAAQKNKKKKKKKKIYASQFQSAYLKTVAYQGEVSLFFSSHFPGPSISTH